MSARPSLLSCAALALAFALSQAGPATAALTLTARPHTVRPGGSVTVRASSAARCRMVVERSESGPVTHREWFSGGRTTVHVASSAAVGQRLVDVTCDREHARARFRVDDGYRPSGPEGNQDPGVDSSGTLGGSYFVNARLADVALRQLGRRAGPCREAVIDWARRVSGGSVRLGGAYVADLRGNGGVEVRPDAARKGDVIQLYDRKDPNAFKFGMHTAVVVDHVRGSAVFDVVDSNFDGTQRVERHDWNPLATAKRYGLSVSIWQLGTVAGVHGQPTPSSGSAIGNLPAQLFHVVVGCRHAGCGVIVRAWPGIRFRQLGVLYDAQRVPVLCQAQGQSVSSGSGATSDVWDGLSTGGYVPDLYLNTPHAGTFSPSIRRCGTTAEQPSPVQTPSPTATYAETTGGLAHTWSSYVDAGGAEGPTIATYATIQIACKVPGFQVADGNIWWYRIASSPWSGAFYVSADAFYNNGGRSGSLRGTPFVDPVVPDC